MENLNELSGQPSILSFFASCRRYILRNCLVFGTGCLGFGSPEDLSEGFCASRSLRARSQDKLNREGGDSGILWAQKFPVCCEEAERETDRVKSLLSKLWSWLYIVVALDEFLQKRSWKHLAQLNSGTYQFNKCPARAFQAKNKEIKLQNWRILLLGDSQLW